MGAYILRRVLLMFPTIFLIILVNFLIIQCAPGGPVDLMIAKLKSTNISATERMRGTASSGELAGNQEHASGTSNLASSKYRGARGIDPALIKALEKQFGFDQPIHKRFLHMLWNYVRLDFGTSFYSDRTFIELMIEKMPVSISLGLWSALIINLISIPLGIRKAVKDGSRFDIASSTMITIGYAIPGFLFAIFLIVLFAGGNYFNIFPLSGIVSENWHSLSFFGKIGDYLWHMVLPITTLVIGGFASLTIFTKNLFMDQINQQYVITARAKGLTERKILFGHIFRNAMLIIVSGWPGMIFGILFTGSLLVEIIFSLDGLGLLGFEAALNRDYPIMFGSLFVGCVLGQILYLVNDLMYKIIDPRIDFESREV